MKKGENKKNPNPTIALNTRVTILDGKDDELKWQSCKQTLFHYINRMGHFYRDMLINNGFENEVLKITNNEGLDYIFDFTGNKNLQQNSLRLLKKGIPGTIVLVLP
mgnify:CR=1 FL=1